MWSKYDYYEEMFFISLLFFVVIINRYFLMISSFLIRSYRMRYLYRLIVLAMVCAFHQGISLSTALAQEVFNGHKVVLDSLDRIIPWHSPASEAYDHFLDLRWDFIKTRVPDCPGPPPRSFLSL